jgi:hypothetical protein
LACDAVTTARLGDPNAAEFSSWLLDVGHGCNSNENGKIRIPNEMLVNEAADLINSIYPGIDSPQPPPPQYFLDRMILAPRNLDVLDINHDILDKMAGNACVLQR